ncbi:hypothetical protein BN946_scf184748.g4 [Trametes cinnabarina]|uniref:Uncharacterized protein n=1 Tax=Pycnoporus cinnabarinus TaxID=5643 RepID=A0A060S7Y1_PYCCI|nr:hypothetical protein BN946_scf184748.g4 [Trametes cinnabarina]
MICTNHGLNTNLVWIQTYVLSHHDPPSLFVQNIDIFSHQDGYRITAFVAGHSAIAGRILPLNNIAGHSTRTLDQLLRDHLLQGLLKHVKGQGERHWDFSGAFDLSDMRLWGTDEAKERLELELEHRLLDLQLVQGSDNDGPPSALLPAALPSGVPVSFGL